jgi:hypothetical protein
MLVTIPFMCRVVSVHRLYTATCAFFRAIKSGDVGMLAAGIMQSDAESLVKAMQLFVKFAEERHSEDPVKLAEQYKQFLLEISTGSWSFCKEFQTWRAEKGV